METDFVGVSSYFLLLASLLFLCKTSNSMIGMLKDHYQTPEAGGKSKDGETGRSSYFSTKFLHFTKGGNPSFFHGHVAVKRQTFREPQRTGSS